MRKLNFNALLNMDRQQVIVKDLEYDEYNQVCTVYVRTRLEFRSFMSNKCKLTILGIDFKNEEFTFQMDKEGKCVNGKFEVYSLN